MHETLSIINKDIRPAAQSSSSTGRAGEKLAAEFLVKNGFRIMLANFKVPIGRNTLDVSVSGEIDIIAADENILSFVEVKTRRSDSFGGPLSAVDLRKQRQITRTARVYLKIFGIRQVPYRFDVVTVVLIKDNDPKVELIKGFWSEQKFRKKAWRGDIF